MRHKEGTIIRLFGADGVGKTTLVTALAQDPHLQGRVTTFEGTHPETWPDNGLYKQQLAHAGIDENSGERYHVLDKIRRCYELAGRIAAASGVVILDSDPFAKTILYNGLRAVQQPDRCPGSELLAQYNQLTRLTHKAAPGVDMVNLHVRLGYGTVREHGQTLMERINRRGGASVFDPVTSEEAGLAHKVAIDTAVLLLSQGETVSTVVSDDELTMPAIPELAQNIQQTYL
jgi:energy-coupling factor transporter ATP-binding protein EcfA2